MNALRRSRRPRRRAPRLIALTITLAVVAAACSGDYNRVATSATTTTTPRTATTTTAPRATTTTTTTSTLPPSPTTTTPGVAGATTTTVAGSPAGLPGRIAVITLDGSLLTVRPDGTDPLGLAIGSPGTSVSSPTWSSDASRLIWTALATNSVRVRTARADGGAARDATLSPPASVYLWNRQSTSVAALRALSTTSVELDAVDLATLASTPLRSGSQVYAAWSPDGSRLLVHAGASELSIVRTNGAITPLGVTSGSFGTPQWLDDKTVLVGVRVGTTQYLSLVDVDTGSRRDLVSYTGAIRFQLDTSGTRVAYQVQPESGGGTNVSFRPQTTIAPQVPNATANQLATIDIVTRAVTTVSQTVAAAFVWSPTGSRLAFLGAEANDTYRWHYWNQQDTIDGAMYVPPRSFLQQYVRSFDQYAQSVLWWSPDGRAFVYAGRAGSRNGIWVQQVQSSVAPALISEGDTAIWSPR